MRKLNISLKALQILFIVVGIIMLVSVISDAARYTLPYQAYEEKVFLKQINNSLYVITLFVGATALETLVSKTEMREE
ncbi:MAG: hypothetical protein GY832_24590 [Chloroflexi bacterium]|nr:hypothetical protein [Chloroflexota bacterium]